MKQEAPSKERSVDIGLIRKVGEKIASTLDLGTVIDALHSYLNSVMDARGINIYVYSSRTNCLESRYKSGDYRTVARDVIPADSLTSFSAWVFRTGEAVVINDFLSEYRNFSTEITEFYHSKYVATAVHQDVIMQSFINLPMSVAGETVGILNVYSFQKNAYDPAHVEMLKALASYVAIALHNNDTFAQLQAAKKLIEEKNKDITDSIIYAKRIQQAKLPELKRIFTALPDSFVLFKPKDIVSGDFYFFHESNGLLIIAAADCTGHGVPGAFMSLIGSEKLEEAVSRSSDVSEILSLLNNGIRTALKQGGNDATRDGMDIALCSIDPRSGLLHFAGANRPLWIIRSDQDQIEVISSTKKAIGGFTEHDQVFEGRAIGLGKGDAIYMFSDGYADTFGGELGKKITTGRFRQVLLDIRKKPMRQQGEYLESFLETWKGVNDQVDDILVIGVRL